MKKTLTLLALAVITISCEKERCVTCIAESNEGKIIETRASCDGSSRYLNGFVDGFKEKHQESEKDSVTVHCIYTQ